MTKKDYELFANEINKLKNYKSGQVTEELVNLCVTIFRQDNHLFQTDKFVTACYEGKHIRKSIKGGV